MNDAEIQAAMLAAPNGGRANDNEGPFSIGQNIWPGLSKLVEEASEVIQISAKLIATGGRVDHWSGLHLGRALEEELGDLQAAIEFVVKHNADNVDERAIAARRMAKLALFEKWHQPSER